MVGSDALRPVPPGHLAERALAARGDIEGERKQVTIVFADVVGSTSLASGLDPEDLVDVLNGLFARWVDAVHRYEGTVDKFLGDGMLALFGAPLAHEDDPRRAAMASLAMLGATRAYADEAGIEIQARIGINTGTVVVGAVGSDARMEYTAMGDAVNVAQRIEAAARPGTVFVGEATRRLIAPYFDIRPAGLFELKGKTEPAPLFEVHADLGLTSTVRGVEGLTSPMVGRDAELRVLDDMLGSLADGTGGVVAVVGDPGLGKSRLLTEAHARAEARGLTWAEGHSPSYGKATPYLPLREAIGRIPGDAADEDVAELLRGEGNGLDAEARHRRIIAAVRRVLTSRAPLVLAIEDLHWADEVSVDVIEAIARTARASGILLIVTSRPDASVQVDRLSPVRVDLERLPHDDALSLVENYLAPERLPDPLRTMVLDKAQGNPFFIEEFLRELIEEGVLERVDDEWRATRVPADLSVPATLEGLIAARIDRLQPAAKRVLQAASVVGRTFSGEVVAAMGEAPEGVYDLLEEAGFLVRGSDATTRAFRHVITQEVAYDTALKRTRRELHRRAAAAIEQLYPGEVELRAAELGRHHDLGGQPAQAVHHLGVAGRRAAEEYASEASLALLERALELAADDATQFELLSVQARVLGVVGRHGEELEVARRMIGIAETLGDVPRRLAGLEASARALVASDYRAAPEVVAEAFRLADRLGDRRVRARLLRLDATLHFTQYSPVRARESLEEALGIFEDEGMTWERADALAGLVRAVTMIEPAGVHDLAAAALEAAVAAGDPRLRAGALVQLGLIDLDRGAVDAAVSRFGEAAHISEEIGDLETSARAQLLLGHAHGQTGDLDTADSHFDAAMDTALAAGSQMGWLYGAMGRVEHWECHQRFQDLLSWLEEILPEVAARGHRHNHSYVRYAIGYRALRWLGRHDEALGHVDAARELTAGDDWNPPAVMFRNARAALLLDLGRIGEAKEVVDEARWIAREHELEEVTLSYLLVTGARVAIAQGDLERAREEVASLADLCRGASWTGERHAEAFLSAELALAAGDATTALGHARRSADLEPLAGATRWFSRLEVLELLARCEQAAGLDPGPTLEAARSELEERLAEIPPEGRRRFHARREVAALTAP